MPIHSVRFKRLLRRTGLPMAEAEHSGALIVESHLTKRPTEEHAHQSTAQARWLLLDSADRRAHGLPNLILEWIDIYRYPRQNATLGAMRREGIFNVVMVVPGIIVTQSSIPQKFASI